MFSKYFLKLRNHFSTLLQSVSTLSRYILTSKDACESKFISQTRKKKSNNVKRLWGVSKLCRGIFYNTQEESEYPNECRCFVVISEFFIEAVCRKVVYQPLRSFVNHREWNIVQYSPKSVKTLCLFILLKRLVVTLSN